MKSYSWSQRSVFAQILWTAIFVFSFIIVSLNVFGLGKDYASHETATDEQWPRGMSELVNTTNRVHGFLADAADIFFFSGTTTNFSVFLEDYSKIEGIEKHCLILHEGTGVAKSPWDTNGRPCDWKLYGCPKWWRNILASAYSKQTTNSIEALQKAGQEPGYVLEVHFWTGGHIELTQVRIPKNIEIKKDTNP